MYGYEIKQAKLVSARRQELAKIMLLGREKLEDRTWDETYHDLVAIWLSAFNGGLLPDRHEFSLMHNNLMLALNTKARGNDVIFSETLEGAMDNGIDHFLNAYLAGVPIDDLIGR